MGTTGGGGALLTLNGVEGAFLIARLEVPELLADDEGQLNLVVKIHALGPDDRTGARQQDGRGGLQEEEGLLGPRAVQLCDMVAGATCQHGTQDEAMDTTRSYDSSYA